MSSAPLAIAVVAIARLYASGSLQSIVSSFFDDVTPQDQFMLIAAVGGLLYWALSVSQFVQDDAPPKKPQANATLIDSSAFVPNYPTEEIEKASTPKDKFMAVYPMLRDEMLVHMKDVNEMPQEAIDWCRDMLEYNVPGGKLNRGMTVVQVQETLVGRPLTLVEYARASVLGWAIEFLQAFFLVADDVMDDSVTRRGQPCWYRLPKVKLIAINDSFLLESYVMTILKNHFSQEDYYLPLVELFLDTIQKTEFGQLLDLTSQPMDVDPKQKKKIDLSRFTLERYRKIVKYKTAFYTFYLSVAIGMITSGVKDQEAYALARNICCIMGEYFQIQDDYLDCFGDPAVIGKVGTDIQDNKCSWLVVQALNRATPAQRKILEDNYGQWDDKRVERIKKLYKEMDLPQVFATYEEDSYKNIQSELDKVTLMPKEVFEILLKKIYKRSK